MSTVQNTYKSGIVLIEKIVKNSSLTKHLEIPQNALGVKIDRTPMLQNG